MNIHAIISYYLKDVPAKHCCFQVHADENGEHSLHYYACVPDYNKPEPSLPEMSSIEAEAMTWYASQNRMTYDALFKLLSRSLRAHIQLYKDELKASSNAQEKMSGYMLSELERDISTGEIYNNGDSFQRAEFDVIRSLFVSGGVLSQEQADTWGDMELVS